MPGLLNETVEPAAMRPAAPLIGEVRLPGVSGRIVTYLVVAGIGAALGLLVGEVADHLAILASAGLLAVWGGICALWSP